MMSECGKTGGLVQKEGDRSWEIGTNCVEEETKERREKRSDVWAVVAAATFAGQRGGR